jgi:hypothetical protein
MTPEKQEKLQEIAKNEYRAKDGQQQKQQH